MVLKLDAEICMPTVGLTTTTRSEDFSLDDLKDAEKQLFAALRSGRRIGARGRRRKGEASVEALPLLRYCGFLEWTTGQGTHASGYRRPHMHHLVKGVPADHELLQEFVLEDADVAKRLGKHLGDTTTPLEVHVSTLWHEITGDAFIVEVRRLRTPVGAIRYLALHNRKIAQGPPPGFKGRRLRPSRKTKDRPGYYESPITVLRALAQELARHERVFGVAQRALGIELFGDEAPDEWEADAQLTDAMAAALRSMVAHPSALQLDLDGKSTTKAERSELLHRVVAEFEQLREKNPPELVRVRERPRIDEETGEEYLEAVLILAESYEADPFRPRVMT